MRAAISPTTACRPLKYANGIVHTNYVKPSELSELSELLVFSTLYSCQTPHFSGTMTPKHISVVPRE